MGRIPPSLIACVLMTDSVIRRMAGGLMVMTCGINTMCMRGCVVIAAMAVRGAEMPNPALQHKHHGGGENKYLHHPLGPGNEPSNACHAIACDSSCPGNLWGLANLVNGATMTVLRWLQKRPARMRICRTNELSVPAPADIGVAGAGLRDFA